MNYSVTADMETKYGVIISVTACGGDLIITTKEQNGTHSQHISFYDNPEDVRTLIQMLELGLKQMEMK